MITLNDVAGNLHRRDLHTGIISKDKILYVTYQSFRASAKLGDRYIAPIGHSEMIKVFNNKLFGWGFTADILKDWELCIDARDEYWTPHTEVPALLTSLEKTFKDITIFSNSLFDPLTCNYNVEFHPYECLTLRDWYNVLEEQHIDWEKLDIEKHFIILARRPSVKRVNFVKSILDTFTLDNVLASCGSVELSIRNPLLVRVNKDNIDKNTPISEKTEPSKKIEDPTHLSFNGYKELFSPYPYPMMIDGIVSEKESDGVILDNIFYKNLVNIISETLDDDNEERVNLSEKTFKAFAWHQIPIWHASVGHVRATRDAGFDVFDDIFDHSYDDILIYKDRKESVLKELVKFFENYPTVKDIRKLRKTLFPRLVRNNQHVQTLFQQVSVYHSSGTTFPSNIFRK